MDIADIETAQQPAVVFLPGMTVVLPDAPAPVESRVAEADDSSTSARQRKERALQRRKEGISHDPMTALYQISSLLTLSTFFEYKVSRMNHRADRWVCFVQLHACMEATKLEESSYKHQLWF
jgi:hypothetical protein